ncbi:DNA-binding protein [Halobellus rufus]|uniref:DNA-binding protein n=1 Tax=Halobellus rufus TaxID=1448860 RepID=UPI000678FF5C|nr:DNA-binding protein [Halobellus rufus]
MSSTNVLGEEVSDVEQADEWVEAEDEIELRPSVEQEIHAKVDLNHPDTGFEGLTLAEEERLEAREWEVERTKVRFDRRQTSDREARTRTIVKKVSTERRRKFGKRAACVDRWADPDDPDPREQVSRDELGEINREAARLAAKLPRWSRAAISRRIAERVLEGTSMMGAVVGVFEEFQEAPGQILPISIIGEVGRREVSVDGTVTQLWEPSHPKIAQVGLLEDESGRVKFTVWKRSNAPIVREGERVQFHDVATSWYQGRVSIAVTGWSRLSFPERERWWAE